MSEQNPNGQQIISWPAAGGPYTVPQGAPQVQAPPYFGTQPPAWTGAAGPGQPGYAEQQAAVVAPPAPVIAQLPPPPFEGGVVVTGGEKSAEQLVAEGQADAAAKKAVKAAEKEARKRWATPWDRFNAWQAEFGFTLDVCADETNHKLPRWYGPGSPLGFENGLAAPVAGERIWCNAPGFDQEWVKWAWSVMSPALPREQRPQLIVQLRPANQTEQPFWTEYVEQFRDFNGYALLSPYGIDFRVRFLSPRVEHVPPPGIKESGPRSGHVLLIWRQYGC